MQKQEVKRLLVAVDGSNRSSQVVDKAIMMAKALGAKVFLVHVRQKVPDLIGQPYYQQLLDKCIDQAEEVVALYRATLDESGVECEELILDGDPAEAIITAAEVEKCELIVMGTRGLSELQGLALGSASHKVLHSAKCMVLIIP